jgi:hypothetical protein
MTGEMIIVHSFFEKGRIDKEGKWRNRNRGKNIRSDASHSLPVRWDPQGRGGTLTPWDYPGEDRLKNHKQS